MTVVLDGHLQEPPGELCDLRVRQPGVRLADVDQPARLRVFDRERVIGKHAFSLAVAPFDRRHDDVECRERPLQFQPGQPATPGRVRAQWVFDHQALVASAAGLGEDAIEVLGIGRLLEPREQVGMLEPQTFQQLAPRRERLVEQRTPVEPQQVEDHEHDRDIASKVGIDLLAAQAALQLEEPQYASIPMGQHLPVEEDVVSKRWRGLGELGKCRRGFFQVARKKLDARRLAMHLAADAVVLLLGPYLARGHALEHLAWRLDRTGEHESNWLEERDRAGLEMSPLAPHRRLADIAGDEMDPFDLRDRHAECLGDRGLDQALAQADPHLAGDDLDEEPGRFWVHQPHHRFQWGHLRVASRAANRF